MDRRDLTALEIVQRFREVDAFMTYGDQTHSDRFADKTVADETANGAKDFAQMMAFDWMRVWIYPSGVDVDNDGIPVPVMIWRGEGVEEGGGDCGVPPMSNRPWDWRYLRQRVFVLAPDGHAIDENRTREVFGAQSDVSRGVPSKSGPFRSLADSIGLFQYRGRIYINTEDKPKTEYAGESPIKIYMRDRSRTSLMCEIAVRRREQRN